MNTTKNKLTLKNQLSSVITIDPEFLKTCIIPRSLDSKKGDNGTVLIVGGNRIYHGAPILASLSALRSGTDLVYTAVPRSNIIPVRSSSPNIIALPLADDKLTVGSANRLVAMLPKKPEAARHRHGAHHCQARGTLDASKRPAILRNKACVGRIGPNSQYFKSN